ncbi:MAG: AmmeMemoRadiSam system protein B [Chloroflexi bacterium]|nr:AmmeMemoRadiSam system protein B [Chloroflexota bacterium]
MKIKLRALRAQPHDNNGSQGVILSDPLGISTSTMFFPGVVVFLLSLMDGTRDAGGIRAGFQLHTGIPVSQDQVNDVIQKLDDAVFLDNEHYIKAYTEALNDYRSAPSRPPILAGQCYPAYSNKINLFFKQYFSRIEDSRESKNVRGLISPHIDFQRGGDIYARVWAAAKTAVTEADLIVILGTDHNEGEGRITLTCQSYETPFGIIQTDTKLIEELAKIIGKEAAFEFELNNRGEHSIESAIVWIQYLLDKAQTKVLPVLCGSFHNFFQAGISPLRSPTIALTVEFLRKLAGERRVLFVAAADMAHQGPAFGDPFPLDIVGYAKMNSDDEGILKLIGDGTAEEFYAEIARDCDKRHICGVSPIYIMKSIIPDVRGKLVGYAQCPASEDGTSQVSICGMIF